MTITEADAVQKLFRFLVKGALTDAPEDTLEAAAYLADRSQRVLLGGQSGDDIRKATGR